MFATILNILIHGMGFMVKIANMNVLYVYTVGFVTTRLIPISQHIRLGARL